MDENKVTISLREYIFLYEGQKETNIELQTLLETILGDTDLDISREELSLCSYKPRTIEFLKEKYPERYAKRLETLKGKD